MKNLFDLSIEDLKEYLVSNGEPRYRASQIFSALHQGKSVNEMSNIPVSLRERLKNDFHVSLPKIVNHQKSSDGTQKFLLEMADGAKVETVLLVQDYGNTACISTQVGCKMGCRFCASGKHGFKRNLSAGEVLSQILLLEQTGATALSKDESNARYITNIVIMGMGEPLDNFENTMKFLQLVSHKEGIHVSGRNISLSTVGLPDGIRAFADFKMQVNLCISLHAPNDEIRKTIMPMAKVHSVKSIMDAVEYFYNKTHRRVIFEYAMIDGINCSAENGLELAKLLKSLKAKSHINLINLNATGGEFSPPTFVQAKIFMDTLIKNGISCTMRKSKGSDIDAACGQLAAKVKMS